jgi:hypothetical protein
LYNKLASHRRLHNTVTLKSSSLFKKGTGASNIQQLVSSLHEIVHHCNFTSGKNHFSPKKLIFTHTQPVNLLGKTDMNHCNKTS